MQFKLTFLFFAISFFLVQVNEAQSQTSDEITLEKASKMYLSLNLEVENFHKATAMDLSKIPEIENSINQAEALLDDISKVPDKDFSKIVKYLRANLEYNRGVLYAFQNEDKKMINCLLPLKSYFDEANVFYFPIEYTADNLSYTIDYSSFESTRGNYYMALATTCLFNGPVEVVPELCRKGLVVIRNNSAKVKLIHMLLAAKVKLGNIDEELAEQAVNYITTYNEVNSKDTAALISDGYSYIKGYAYLQGSIEQNPKMGNQGSYNARAASGLVKANDNVLAAIAYKKAMEAGYNEKNFLFEVAEYNGMPNTILRKTACNSLAAMNDLACYELGRLSRAYAEIGMQAEASQFGKQAEICTTLKEKQARKAASSRFHLYLGTYPLRLLATKEYRDYGVAGGFTANKFMMLGSYMQVNKNHYSWTDMTIKSIHDNTSGKYYWSGKQLDITFRFTNRKFQRKSASLYWGPQFEYSERKISTLSSDVTNTATGVTNYAVSFEPLDKQYQLALNGGFFNVGKYFAFDFSVSMGTSYCDFSLENPSYNLSDYTFSHSYLNNREEWHWGMVFKVNFTVGIYL